MAMTFFKTTYLCNKLLDYFFGSTSWTPPTTLYFGLFTTAPSQPAGTGGVECAIGTNSYARATITNNGGGTQWNAAASAQKTNVVDITFNTPTSTGWGTVVAVGIFDASTAGNLLWVCVLGTSKTVGAGTVVNFKGSTSTGTTGNCIISEA